MSQGHFDTPRVGSNQQPSGCQTTALITLAISAPGTVPVPHPISVHPISVPRVDESVAHQKSDSRGTFLFFRDQIAQMYPKSTAMFSLGTNEFLQFKTVQINDISGYRVQFYAPIPFVLFRHFLYLYFKERRKQPDKEKRRLKTLEMICQAVSLSFSSTPTAVFNSSFM